MKHVNIAILDIEKRFAKELGKKGSESDFTLYNFKNTDAVLIPYEPTLYPDKIQPLLYSLQSADYALLVVRSISKELGEMIVALEAIQKPGFIIYAGVEKEQLAPLLKGTIVEKYEELADEPIAVREKFISLTPPIRDGPTKVPIDHCFDVKSVGTVALGIVVRGSVLTHQDLELAPSGKMVSAKSLQVQDVDVKEAPCGSRVGVCVKGADVNEVDRGFVFAEKGSLISSKQFDCDVSVSKFYKEEIKEGNQLYVSFGMQYMLGRPVKIAGNRFTFECDKPIAFEKGERFLLVNPSGKLRIVGSGIVV